ncbi:DUF5034 domain-containing protein [Pseudoalteromonas phenolica]|uniref:DUF5034 domain-containing protein n=1 Tax=Pseudoalteromonas phenolica TaxID=161398 RepID=UPI00110A2E42|nr:DUF5034 domain-containing protein [Pseudoalteromonas phenolica]TMO55904.1 hypothetical protein CWC21_08225 [Pseudoalteromonas phenolica]
MKRSTIFTSALLALLIAGCSNDEEPDNPCGSFSNPEYVINDYTLSVFNSDLRGEHVSGDVYESVDAIDFKNFIIKLEIEKNSLAKRFDSVFDFSLMGKAYACSPVLPFTEQRISSIKITSSAAFNDDLPAGSSLNDVFDVVYLDYVPTPYYSEKNGDVDYFSVAEFIAQPDNMPAEITQLALNTEPKYKQNHIFYIEINFHSGEQFLLESREISFNQ